MKRQQNLKLISLLICVICYINIMASLVSAENIELNANPLYSNISGYDTQKNLIKNVTQWTMLPRNERTIPLIENDTEIFYSATKSIEGNPMWGVDITYYDISELPWVYVGAGHHTTDRIFLLDDMQLYSMWENFGSVKAFPADPVTAAEEVAHVNTYYLRTPSTADRVLGTNIASVSDESYCMSAAFLIKPVSAPHST